MPERAAMESEICEQGILQLFLASPGISFMGGHPMTYSTAVHSSELLPDIARAEDREQYRMQTIQYKFRQ